MTLIILGLNFVLIGVYDKKIISNFDFNEKNSVYIHLSTIVLFFVGYYVNSKKIDKTK